MMDPKLQASIQASIQALLDMQDDIPSVNIAEHNDKPTKASSNDNYMDYLYGEDEGGYDSALDVEEYDDIEMEDYWI